MIRKSIYAILSLLCLGITMVACSEHTESAPRTELSLKDPRYTLGNSVGDSVKIAVVTEGKALSKVRIPFRLSSKSGAVLNEDYTISDSVFTLNQGDSIAYLVVKRKAETDQKTFLLTLLPTEGVKLGALNYIQVELEGYNIYSFLDRSDELTMSREYTVKLTTPQGKKFSYAKDTRLEVEVDPLSTAVEGEHFQFTRRRKYVQFKAGKDEGTVSLTFMKVENGKDHIVLRVADKYKLKPGAYPTINIRIVGYNEFNGTWKFHSVYNKNWWKNDWGQNTDVLIDSVGTDRFTLVGTALGGYDFTPHFTGKLKNYFTSACRAEFKGERLNFLQEAGGNPPPRISLSEYEFQTINVAFSDTQSNIRKALVGMRMVRDENEKRMLEISLYDYEPVEPAWADVLKSMKMYQTEPPYMLDGPIRIRFTRVP